MGILFNKMLIKLNGMFKSSADIIQDGVSSYSYFICCFNCDNEKMNSAAAVIKYYTIYYTLYHNCVVNTNVSPSYG